jgi:hypothetical protein
VPSVGIHLPFKDQLCLGGVVVALVFLGLAGWLGWGALKELAGLSVRFRWRSIFLAGRQKGHAGRVRSMGGLAFVVVGAGRWINRKSVAGQNLVVD